MTYFFQNNYIKTSKYSWLTFLPLNLLEQFQRIANFYFLCLLLLQLIPAISSLTPITTAIPLIGVLALTAVKDAYDDIVSFSPPLNSHTYSHTTHVFSWSTDVQENKCLGRHSYILNEPFATLLL